MIECCGVEVVGLNVILLVVYRVPSAHYDIFLEAMYSILEVVCDDNKDIIIGGDFNINLLIKDKQTASFYDLIYSFNLDTLIHEPTRVTPHTETCIDNVLYNKLSSYSASVVKTHVSEHYSQLVTLRIPCHFEDTEYVERRFFSENNVSLFCGVLEGETWDGVLCRGETDDAFNTFTDIVRYHFAQCFPVKRVKIGATNKQTLSPELVELKQHLSLIADLSKRYPIFKETFIKLNKKYSEALNDLRRRNINKKIYLSENKTKAMWHVINENLGRKRDNSDIRIKQDGIYLGKVDTANAFNQYFSTVAKDLTGSPLTKTNSFGCGNCLIISNSFFLEPITSQDIKKHVINLKNSQSSGFDNISNCLLKKIVDFILVPLTYIINLSFEKGVFPAELKHSRVIPVHKKGCEETLANYRPISLISGFSKIIEGIVSEKLYGFLNKFKILQNFQHGFIKGRSINTALDAYINEIVSAIDRGILTVGLFVDFSRAFDCVSHEILLEKLENYGVRGVALRWFASYLSNRTQCVEVGGVSSGNVHIDMGVPQGSVLGPTLFLLYINDLAHSIRGEGILCINYADDTNILISSKNETEATQRVVEVFNKLQQWSASNGLYINEEKTGIVVFSNRRGVRDYTVFTNSFTPTNTIKMLGFTIDEHLQWHAHIDLLSKKLARTNFALRSLAKYCSVGILKTLYFACFQSALVCGIIHWGRSGGVERIFVLQKRAIRTMVGLAPRDSCREAFKNLKIMTVPSLYVFEILCFAFRNRSSFPILQHEYDTRNRNATLMNQRHFTAKYQKQSYFNACKFFNNLPHDTRNIESFHEFKVKIKNRLISLALYTVDEFFGFCC